MFIVRAFANKKSWMRGHPAVEKTLWIEFSVPESAAVPVPHHLIVFIYIDQIAVKRIGLSGGQSFGDMRKDLLVGVSVVRVKDANKITVGSFDAFVHAVINTVVWL